MKLTFFVVCGVLSLFPVLSVNASSPDFNAIMERLSCGLNTATNGAWAEELWPYVTPSPEDAAAWSQQGALFAGFDHTGNGIEDADHLALLQRVLQGDEYVVLVLGASLVTEIQDAYRENRQRILAREAWYDLEILNTSSTSVRRFGVALNDRPMYMARTRLYTGQENTLNICVDLGVLTVCNEERIVLPGIWAAGGLLDENAPGLASDLADLLAAYLTIGEQNGVDYLQALIYQVLCRGILSRAAAPIFNNAKEANVRSPQTLLTGAGFYDGGKAYAAPVLSDILSDTAYEPPVRNCLNSGCTDYADIVRIVTLLYGDSMAEGIGQNWLAGYTIGENGFGPGYTSLLGAAGDFNNDGITNVDAYAASGGDRDAWLLALGLPAVVSTEGEDVVDTPTVPPLENRSLADAESLFEAAGAAYTVVYECSDAVPENNIIRTVPAGGAPLPTDSPVELVVSTGRCAPDGCAGLLTAVSPANIFLGALAFLVLLVATLFGRGDPEAISALNNRD